MAHEAELIALTFAADEGVWLRRMLKDIKFAVNSAKPKYFATIKRGTATTAPREHTFDVQKVMTTDVQATGRHFSLSRCAIP